MKTTIELPEDLFREAKVVAARRRITLKTLFTQALRKEITPAVKNESDLIRVDEEGLPYLPKRGQTITSEQVQQLNEASEE